MGDKGSKVSKKAILDKTSASRSRRRCVDCRYYFRRYYGYNYASGPKRCLHPAFFHPIEDDGVPLNYARLESKKCGPEGKLWEAISEYRKQTEARPIWCMVAVFGFIISVIVSTALYIK